jgi:hydrogenase nickel incorporation protein HypB
MCTTCGCGNSDGRGIAFDGASASRTTAKHTVYAHDHEHAHQHTHGGGDVEARLIMLEKDLLAKNAGFAEGNRRLFVQRGVFAVNLVSSPGSGKTTLLARTASDLGKQFPIGVIEGDQQTSRDAERIRAAGVPAIQISTGKVCHLDAHMIGHAVEQLQLSRGYVLFIENVGNLVCPAGFDLGERHKIVVVSVTEGEDKPLKYPDMFAAADLMILNKIDLLPYVDFDVARCVEYARRIKPAMDVIELSAATGRGLEPWYAWLRAGAARAAGITSTAADAADASA